MTSYPAGTLTRKSAALMFGLLSGLVTQAAQAQTCPATPITGSQVFSGTTCGNTTPLPWVANGAIYVGGPQAFYTLSRGDSGVRAGWATLTPAAGAEMTLAVCRDICSAKSTCIGVADSTMAKPGSVALPAVAGDYTVIVSTRSNCSNFTLSAVFNLD